MRSLLCALIGATLLLQSCSRGGKTYSGKASYYSVRSSSSMTASGERLRDSKLTAAHKTLAFGTRVRVTNKLNGRSVVVRINDRGPYKRGRIIDVSLAAAKRLRMTRAGVVPVKIKVLR